MRTLIIFPLAMLLFVSIELYSQSDLKVEHISLEQGVSNNLIYSIYQDSKGFLWFGTMFGLVKYDGIEFKTYRYDPQDSNSLSNDDIISLYEDREGFIWVGTFNGGLNRYDRSTGKFRRYLHDPANSNSISSNSVWTILQDKKGVMWFGTERGGLCSMENEIFRSYKRDTSKKGAISGNNIRSIAEDRNGNLWIGTLAAGLNKFDSERKFFTVYKHDVKNEKSLGNNFVGAINEDDAGQLWIGTGGGGLNMYNPSTDDFVKFKSNTFEENNISNDFVFSIVEDGDHLLIGTQDGLNKFDKTKKTFERITVYPERKDFKESIIAFIKDKSDVIWVSIYMDGLHKIYSPMEKFRTFLMGIEIKCIYEDRSERLWIGTFRNGLKSTTDNGKTFVSYVSKAGDANSISSNTVNSITEDMHGNLWIGTDNGLNKFEKGSGKFYKYFNDPKDKNSLSGNHILRVHFDRSGILWVGTANGLNEFKPDSGKIKHYKYTPNDQNGLNENTILSIYEDRQGMLWIGTYKGLNVIDRTTGKFKHYTQDPNNVKSLSNNYIFSFCEDSNNNFWIGTGGGLNVFDKETESFFHFNERDGLPNGVITGIEESANGDLWLSTMKGVSKFDIKNKTFRNYDTDDGLQSNMFNAGSYFKTKNGEIFFGGINGFNSFHPSAITEKKFTPPVIITSLVKYNEGTRVEQDISGLDEIELCYHENIINLNFASLDYTNPKKNKYAYLLEGFDENWIYSGNSHNVVYTNLDPGVYIFKVKGTNSDGVWNEKEVSFKINISPPFWKTWWFYGILIAALTCAVIVIQNYRVRMRVKNLLELERIKEAEREFMREQASRDYHDELGHKLTRISLYTRRINKRLRPAANGLTNDLNNIVETSNSLQSGAKDLIWAMNPREDTLYDFAVRLRDFGNELFEDTWISFSTDGINDELRDIVLSMNSKRHLIYIFKEGMNNILKYAGCANVNLEFRLTGDELEILMEDNGKGFDVSNCAKGYGLKNIFSRADQVNVNITVTSEENLGTKIKLVTSISNLISA